MSWNQWEHVTTVVYRLAAFIVFEVCIGVPIVQVEGQWLYRANGQTYLHTLALAVSRIPGDISHTGNGLGNLLVTPVHIE